MKLSEELEKWRIDRPDEWKMDEFMRNAEKLESERDTAMAQNLEQLNNCLAALKIANKRIDELEKYNLDLANESHSKSNMIDYEQNKNTELVAQVERLNQAIISTRARGNLLHNITIQLMSGDEITGSDWDYISEEQVDQITKHLRDRDAEVGRDGFVAGAIEWGGIGFADAVETCANKYSGRIRRGEA